MSIFKDTFRDYVRDQLSIREELISLGNTNDQGVRSNRRIKNFESECIIMNSPYRNK